MASSKSSRWDAAYSPVSMPRPDAQFYEPEQPYEYEVARRWWSLPRSICLPLQQGGWCQVVFSGRPGGAMGPDVRDAVLRFISSPVQPQDLPVGQAEQLEKVVGDVEFHVRSSDWRTHQHQSDPVYNHVLLHIVMVCNDSQPTRRQDGTVIPTCTLADVSAAHKLVSFPLVDKRLEAWPCQQLSDPQRHKLLQRAGLLRFEAKCHRFLEELHAMEPAQIPELEPYDRSLFLALSEGLGYGRDREVFRALGMRLLLGRGELSAPLGRSLCPAPLDHSRLHVLMNLFSRWRPPGIWHTLCACLLPPNGANDPTLILNELRACFRKTGLSMARTDILLCNVVFPFAAAVALLEQHELLAERARMLYLQHPGLPSNWITRSMCAQLQLSKEPHGSCLQQGLHYIYQQTCREKDCSSCIIGLQRI
ncbi:hypothetical protein KDK_18670 [Dictyobacter kobayashii]|uniref:DUF2851 domain-containing protein n=2 Tax=Dictyobacter kobayashii TaxID=2014872 RepID=A0A402AG24_9CHLR|nr:hypothetical protein KDK_18670 [Dictyobacter kobayashii]